MIANVAFSCLALTLFSLPISAQEFPIPGKPIRIVIPYAAGGGADVQARAIAQQMSPALGVPVIVESKPGAGTVIAAVAVKEAAPDGHTLLYTGAVTHVQNPHLYSKLPYDAFKDFTPITIGAHSGTVLAVSSSAPFSTVKELVEYAKKHPGVVTYASFAMGSTSHLNGELLARDAGIELVHVPYKGASDASRDLLAGRVHLSFDNPTVAINNQKSGKVRILAAATDARIKALPDIPTMAELGFPRASWTGWISFFAPAGVPGPVVQRLHREIAKAVRVHSVSELIEKGGNEVGPIEPEEFAKKLKSDNERWGATIRSLGIKLD